MSDVLKAKKVKAWLITTICVMAFLIVFTILANTILYPAAIQFLGNPRPILVGGIEGTYYKSFDSKDEARANAEAVNEAICEEGFVLLKNQNGALPLAAGAKISVFGKNSARIVTGGSGSGAGTGEYEISLYDALAEEGFSLNPELMAFYKDNGKSGGGRSSNPVMDNANDGVAFLDAGETPQSSYTDAIRNSYSQYKDAAIVVVSRIGGESFDLPRMQPDGRLYLQLDANERALLSSVAAGGFDKVIVILNMSTYIECGFLDDPSDPDYHQEVGAALWIGAPGDTGIRALGRILKGEVNPSGSLVDTFVKDLTADPAYQNFGDNMSAGGDMYTNVSDKSGGYIYAFVDYEEGVYSGYRYWETRALTDGEQWYKDHVVYPFGYGLSYTTFEQGIKSVSGGISKGSVISVDVEVKNTGSVAGKKSVQLYISAPYTAGGIEKPGVELAGFAKTPEIAPGASKTVTIEIDPYLFASYDYNDKNGNGFSGYELEKGAYVLSLRDNAHSEIESRELSLASDILYETDEASGYNVVNRYEDADDEIETTMMSRSDFEGTFPKSRTENEKVISVATKSGIDSLDSLSPAKYKEFPQYGAEGQYEFYNLINAAYDDPRWEELLNRVTYDEMVELINVGAFNTAYIASIKKPKTIDSDGPAGFAVFLGGGDTVFGTSHYACEPVIAATFNTELAEEMGEAVGEEALIGNGQTPYSGWYAPGLNIHRTAFGGRVGEYFSEDPLLSGLIGASEITGASTKGVYAYIKHFAVNEQETSRNGVATWLSEQALRQIYLRPFELVVKKGKATAIMTSFNRIGTKWTGGDYRLLTEILRNEWGFKGTVITDFNTHPFMDIGQMLSAGGDLNLAFLKEVYKPRKSDATALTELRMATKNILYTVSRSNAIPIEGYSMPIWDIALIIGVCVAGVGFAVWGFFVISSELKKKKLGQGQ